LEEGLVVEKRRSWRESGAAGLPLPVENDGRGGSAGAAGLYSRWRKIGRARSIDCGVARGGRKQERHGWIVGWGVRREVRGERLEMMG
jgi:hypothetical protein